MKWLAALNECETPCFQKSLETRGGAMQSVARLAECSRDRQEEAEQINMVEGKLVSSCTECAFFFSWTACVSSIVRVAGKQKAQAWLCVWSYVRAVSGWTLPCGCSVALVLGPPGDVIGLCLHGDCFVKLLRKIWSSCSALVSFIWGFIKSSEDFIYFLFTYKTKFKVQRCLKNNNMHFTERFRDW